MFDWLLSLIHEEIDCLCPFVSSSNNRDDGLMHDIFFLWKLYLAAETNDPYKETNEGHILEESMDSILNFWQFNYHFNIEEYGYWKSIWASEIKKSFEFYMKGLRM